MNLSEGKTNLGLQKVERKVRQNKHKFTFSNFEILKFQNV
jgi:hypothetical protein